MMKIRIIIVLCLCPFLLLAQGDNDIAELAKIKALELEADGWKAHAGDPSIYEQLYSAYVYEGYYESDNPLNRLYFGHANEEFYCVIDMLVQYAERDIQDWFPEFVKSLRNLQSGKHRIEILAKIKYLESQYEVYIIDRDDEQQSKLSISALDEDFKRNYVNVIIPFAKLYRNYQGRREELIVATFSDEFLMNRRVPIPVYDGYRCQNTEIEFNDSISSYGIQETNLHYQVKKNQESMRIGDGISSSKYESLASYKGVLEDERVKIHVDAFFKLDE